MRVRNLAAYILPYMCFIEAAESENSRPLLFYARYTARKTLTERITAVINVHNILPK